MPSNAALAKMRYSIVQQKDRYDFTVVRNRGVVAGSMSTPAAMASARLYQWGES